ncbi:hypothetical protein RHGRI_032750 [Rhododendron griersonianum]|uniref:Uncharacterized protein n=1 Tax=Rhododendron griersonianum TaxID=479676 RepID=A0AAV6ICX9_9ERIC|nr:hypothetical protein RHGRI_032750 [Rhododendron griersonianum]
MAISLQPCRFTTRTNLFTPETRVFHCRKPISVRCSAGETPSASVSVDSDFDVKVFRHNLTRSENYNQG